MLCRDQHRRGGEIGAEQKYGIFGFLRCIPIAEPVGCDTSLVMLLFEQDEDGVYYPVQKAMAHQAHGVSPFQAKVDFEAPRHPTYG
jgi:hypothetical protein